MGAKSRGIWHTHRLYREHVGRPLLADMIERGDDVESDPNYMRFFRAESDWVSIRDAALIRYFRRFNNGYCSVEQWNTAVKAYCEGRRLQGKGSSVASKGIETYSAHFRVAPKRWVDPATCSTVRGRVFRKADINARLNRFKARLMANSAPEAPTESWADAPKVDLKGLKAPPWVKAAREDLEATSAMFAVEFAERLWPRMFQANTAEDQMAAFRAAFVETVEAA
jgi:hypothetical protein